MNSLNEMHQRVSRGTGTGILLCLGSMFIFAAQDAITKVLVQEMDVAQFIMVRYWVFALFAVTWVVCFGGLRKAVVTKRR